MEDKNEKSNNSDYEMKEKILNNAKKVLEIAEKYKNSNQNNTK